MTERKKPCLIVIVAKGVDTAAPGMKRVANRDLGSVLLKMGIVLSYKTYYLEVQVPDHF